MQTLKEIEDIFQPIFAALLEWSGAQANYVRIGWPEEGQPSWEISDDVIFLTATSIDESINKHHDVLVESSSPDVLLMRGMTRVVEIDVVAYGSNSSANLRTLLLGMFKESYRNELATNNLFYIPDSAEPRRLPELFQGQWWERSDMKLRFNELLEDIEEMNAVESVDVEISNAAETLAEFTI